MRVLLSLFFLVVLISHIQAQVPEIDAAQFVASIQRTTCYGNCPYYEIKYYSNGWATFEGKKNVEWIGLYYANVGKELGAKIMNKAKSINYTDLNHKYPEKGIGIIDFPTCITALATEMGGEKGKKIIYNRNDSPTKLVQYEEFLDELFEEVEWKKVP